MTLPASGTLTFSQIQTEHGGSNPIGLNEYYRQGSIVPLNQSTGSVPTSGALAVSDFYSTEGFGNDFFAFTQGSSGGKLPSQGVLVQKTGSNVTAYGTWNETSFTYSSNVKHVTIGMNRSNVTSTVSLEVSNRSPSNSSTADDGAGPYGDSLVGRSLLFRTGSSTGPIASTTDNGNSPNPLSATQIVSVPGEPDFQFNPASSNNSGNGWFDGPFTNYNMPANSTPLSSGADGTTFFVQVV